MVQTMSSCGENSLVTASIDTWMSSNTRRMRSIEEAEAERLVVKAR
jgi:hypothetical protein